MASLVWHAEVSDELDRTRADILALPSATGPMAKRFEAEPEAV
jgi:hypothetical protein